MKGPFFYEWCPRTRCQIKIQFMGNRKQLRCKQDIKIFRQYQRRLFIVSLSSRAISCPLVGRIWSVGCHLNTPGLGDILPLQLCTLRQRLTQSNQLANNSLIYIQGQITKISAYSNGDARFCAQQWPEGLHENGLEK